MPLLKDFVSVLALNTPLKVTTEDDSIVLYGRCYKNADHDNTFVVYSIDELFEKFGNYFVVYSCIRDNILYIDIDKGVNA
jgi:hypothetical protein